MNYYYCRQCALGILLVLCWSDCVLSDRLAIPADLISLTSPQGQRLLVESESESNAADFWTLMTSYTTQKNNAFCGVASMVTVLNALPTDPPLAPEHDGFHYWTQLNVFNNRVQ